MRVSAYLSAIAILFMGVANAADPPVPVLELTGPSTVEVGKKCVITAATTAKKVTWRAPAGVDVIALDGRRLAVWALPGSYTFTAMVPNGDDVASVDYVLTITGLIPRPPPIPPVLPDPVLPPPILPPSFYFLIVRPDGPVQPEFTRLMADPAWATLKAAKHTYRDVTLTVARDTLKVPIPAGTVLPAVVTLQEVPGAPTKVLRGPIPLPTTGDGISKLPEGVAK